MPTLYQKLMVLLEAENYTTFMPSDKKDLDTIASWWGTLDEPTDEEIREFIPKWQIALVEGKYEGLKK